MTFLLSLFLLGFCLKLRQDVVALRSRLAALEDRPRPSAKGALAPVGGGSGERLEGGRAFRPDLGVSVRTSRDVDPISPMKPSPQAAPVQVEAPTQVERPPLQTKSMASASSPEVQRGFSILQAVSMEDVFGRLLPIWLGGLTLAVAGVLVVKWSIDTGILSPALRVALGFLFGLGLIAGAEASCRASVSDDRIPQALSGAGIASLFGAILAANLLYAIIGDGVALVAMVAVTGLAGLLSLRFGAPSAVLGLVGGLAAPALIGSSSPNVPLLVVYVSIVSIGMSVLARVSGRSWLGGAAFIGGALWALMMMADAHSFASSFATGIMLIILGFGIPALLSSDRTGEAVRLVGAGIACLQIAGLTVAGGFGIVQWSMLGLASLGVMLLSERDASFRTLPSGMLVVTLLTALAWRDASPMQLGAVLIVMAVLHACHAIRHLSFSETPSISDAVRLLVLAPVCCAIASSHSAWFSEMTFALLWGGGAVLTALACMVVSAVLPRIASFAQPVAVLMGMFAFWNVAPQEAVPFAGLLLAVGLSYARGWRNGAAMAGCLVVLHGLPMVGLWFASVVPALSGEPLLVQSLPTLRHLAWTVGPVLILCGLCSMDMRRDTRLRGAAMAIAGVSGLILAHVAWRRMIGIGSGDAYVGLGIFDRTGWQLLLAIAAVSFFRMDRRIAASLALASIAHFIWFSVLVMNPLWTRQIVGSWPFANMVAASFAVPLGLLWAAGRAGLDGTWEKVRSIIQMVLIPLLVFSLLRQMSVGAILSVPGISHGEDIGRSVLAIVMAVCFLVHGIISMRMEWRIGSLVLMLGAISKVFVFDASGLDGLARVASFAALGFSLIGVGWIYSRFLPSSGKRA